MAKIDPTLEPQQNISCKLAIFGSSLFAYKKTSAVKVTRFFITA